MRKRLIVMLLVFLPTFSPVPGQTTGPTGDRGGKINKSSEGKGAGAAPAIPAAEPNKPQASDKNGADIAPKNPEYNIKLTGSLW